MKIGDLVKLEGTQVGPGLIVGVAYGYEDAPCTGEPLSNSLRTSGAIEALQTMETRWVLAYHAEVLSETR